MPAHIHVVWRPKPNPTTLNPLLQTDILDFYGLPKKHSSFALFGFFNKKEYSDTKALTYTTAGSDSSVQMIYETLKHTETVSISSV